MKLEDKVVIITGAASGIGAACAERFANEGAKVVIADINVEDGQAVANKVEGHFIQTDVSKADQVEKMISETVSTFGKLDILMNNAGIDGVTAPLAEATIENFQQVTDVNLAGVYYGMKFALQQMEKQGSGVILNVASIAGMVGYPGITAYTAAKGGVINLTRAAALEYAPKKIRVNALGPGMVMTPLVQHYVNQQEDPEGTMAFLEQMNPYPGVITLDAVANAALFLVSDDSAFITGHTLMVDGGYTAR